MFRSRRSEYTLVCLAHTFLHTFTQMHIAITPVLRAELGVDTFTIGLMASIPLVVQGVMTVPSGLLADRVDRLRLMAASLALSAVGGVLMTQVTSVPLLIFFVSFFSISSTLLHPPALSIISDLVAPERRGKALGVFNSVGVFGISLGPITQSLFMDALGWRLVYLMWSVPAVCVAALVLRLKFDKPDDGEVRRPRDGIAAEFHILRNLGLITLLVILGLRAMSGNSINTYITPYFVDMWALAPATASLIFGIRSLVGIFAASGGGVMVDRIGAKRWIALGLVFQVASISVIAFTTSLTWIIPSYLLYAFFSIMEMPAVHVLISRLTSTSSRGLAFAVSFLPNTVMGAISPLLAAFIVEAWGMWHIFPFALGMLSTGLLLMGLLWRRPAIT
jgi:MFS family permease